MILTVLAIMLVIATAWSALAMIWKRAPVASGIISTACWIFVGYGASSIDLVTENGQLEEGVASEPALVVLAFGMALLSILVVIAAITGNYVEGEEHGTDRPMNPNEVF